MRSLRSAFVEVHEELEAKFPNYEAQSREHSHMAQVYAVPSQPDCLLGPFDRHFTQCHRHGNGRSCDTSANRSV